jgi:hypothetical protein
LVCIQNPLLLKNTTDPTLIQNTENNNKLKKVQNDIKLNGIAFYNELELKLNKQKPRSDYHRAEFNVLKNIAKDLRTKGNLNALDI